MNICEVIRAARKKNCMFRRSAWNDMTAVFHGMDNILHYFNEDWEEKFRPLHSGDFAVATFLQDDWELVPGTKYHGPLSKE